MLIKFDCNNLVKMAMFIDSYVSHHLVNDVNLLEKFTKFVVPKPISTALFAFESNDDANSLGENKITIFVQFEDEITKVERNMLIFTLHTLELTIRDTGEKNEFF